jgi:cytoskeletal protein RodZ
MHGDPADARDSQRGEAKGQLRESPLQSLRRIFVRTIGWRKGESADSAADADDLKESEPQDMRETAPPPFANAVDFNPAPREEDGPDQSSDEIFVEIGRQIRERREMLSLTHDEIERHTRVRVSFQEAIEQGSVEQLPSMVQTRGILANYATFIDMDVDSILLRFADGIQARHREQRPHWPPRTRAPMTVHSNLPPLRAFIASDLLFGGGAAIMLILFAVWGINRVVSVRATSIARSTAPSISDMLAGTPLPTVPSEVTMIPAANTPLVPPTQESIEAPPPSPVDPSITVQVNLTADERTYMRVSVDDVTAFEGRTEPGKNYYFQAARQIEVLVGNAAALRVTHNGRELGRMGNYGEVIDQFYTARGIFTPTATLPPTRTPSPTPTDTPRPTPTLATFTPTPKPGQ